ncbi:hypothetical protein BV25DRAFT_1553972 [Artomyces pyxidatus]|uniref:Uncharacterized protein n=1 Tax=Artomyces pyxidatus TaxID=48021 RepID=A0ACB8SJN8_9AGAM|nr:hypothetical protein BV25DRAFT_1553972 [Artomyces pyxidatus]
MEWRGCGGVRWLSRRSLALYPETCCVRGKLGRRGFPLRLNRNRRGFCLGASDVACALRLIQRAVSGHLPDPSHLHSTAPHHGRPLRRHDCCCAAPLFVIITVWSRPQSARYNYRLTRPDAVRGDGARAPRARPWGQRDASFRALLRAETRCCCLRKAGIALCTSIRDAMYTWEARALLRERRRIAHHQHHCGTPGHHSIRYTRSTRIWHLVWGRQHQNTAATSPPRISGISGEHTRTDREI